MNSTLFASIGFSICSLFFAFFMLVMYFNKRRTKSLEDKVFIILLSCLFILIFLEFFYVAYLYRGFNMTITKLLCRAWLNGILIWMTLFMYYIFVLRTKKIENPDEKRKKRNIVRIVLGLICLISLVISNLLPISFYDYSYHIYSFAGDATYVGFVLAGLAIGVTVYGFVIRKDMLSFTQKKPVIIMLLILVVITTLQFMNDKFDLNYQNFEFTILLMTLFFTTQNQDNMLLNEHEEAKIEADNANNAQTEFLTSMSHEIRTPMNTIIGFSDALIREGAQNEEVVKSDIKNVHSAAIRLLDLINNILDLSRVNSEKEQIIEKEFDTDASIVELDKTIKNKLSDSINYVLEVDEKLPKRLSGDNVKINKIVANLMSNVISYSKDADITLSIKSAKSSSGAFVACFSIRSNGSSMSAEEYNKYYVGNTENNNVNTNVLELNVAKVYAKMLGTQVIMTNQDRFNIGYDFNVEIVVINPAPMGDIKILLNKEEEVKDINLEGKKALVVDDNTVNIKLIERFLTELKMNVESVTSGDECISKVTNNDYDIIFLDHMMPGKDGIQTLSEMKDKKSNIPPTIALTANSYSGVREFYMGQGFQDYLAKPVNRGELAKILFNYIK